MRARFAKLKLLSLISLFLASMLGTPLPKGIHQAGYPLPAGKPYESSIDEALEAGMLETSYNTLINRWISDTPTQYTIRRKNRTYYFKPVEVEQLDTLANKFRAQSSFHGIFLILLNPSLEDKSPDLIHPLTKTTPDTLYAAFNTSTQNSLEKISSWSQFLSARYGDVLKGFIVGNEIQGHYWWNNLGNAPSKELLIGEYEKAVRAVFEGVEASSNTSHIKVFISMDRYWTETDDRRIHSGRDLLDRFNDQVKENGAFPWHLAWHPYPLNDFPWKDDFHDGGSARASYYSYDTPFITMRNLFVLSSYLQQDRFKRNGKSPRVILSEQGVEHVGGNKTQESQAASYAYYFKVAEKTPLIDSMLWYSHYDHPDYPTGLISDEGENKASWSTFLEINHPDWKTLLQEEKLYMQLQEWNQINPPVCKTIPEPSIVTNLSTRGIVGSEEESMDTFFEIVDENKKVVLRAIGQPLSLFNVTNPQEDPICTLYKRVSNEWVKLLSFNDWQKQDQETIAEITQGKWHYLGSKQISPKDAVTTTTLSPGSYWLRTSANTETVGNALFDMHIITSQGMRNEEHQMIKFATKNTTSTEDENHITSFAISGPGTTNVSISVEGPTLDAENLDGLNDPEFKIVRILPNQEAITVSQNDDWQNALNAYDLENYEFEPRDEREAGLFLKLASGTYSVIVSPQDEDTKGQIQTVIRLWNDV